MNILFFLEFRIFRILLEFRDECLGMAFKSNLYFMFYFSIV